MNAVLTRPAANPFALEDTEAYRRWRERKLAAGPRRAEDLIVEVRDPRNLTNNLLHDRSAFTDAPGAGRLVYRTRYPDRIADRVAAA